MQINDFPKIRATLGLGILLLNFSPVVFAVPDAPDWLSDASSAGRQTAVLLFARAGDEKAADEKPRSGSLVLPASALDKKREKKCMTVCEHWGQVCMIDDVRGVRKCRRTCKEFGQECF